MQKIKRSRLSRRERPFLNYLLIASSAQMFILITDLLNRLLLFLLFYFCVVFVVEYCCYDIKSNAQKEKRIFVYYKCNKTRYRCQYPYNHWNQQICFSFFCVHLFPPLSPSYPDTHIYVIIYDTTYTRYHLRAHPTYWC